MTDLYVDENEVLRQGDGTMKAGVLIGAEQGCENGFCMGVSYRESSDYHNFEVHDDQEGFYVLEGEGMARVGAAEFALHPGVSFLVPRGVPHAIKKCAGSGTLKLLYAHAS